MTVTISGTNGIDKVQDAVVQNTTLAAGVPGRSNLPAGTVLQVVQTYYKSTETIATNSWTATGISASITPSSSTSKILVIVNITASSSNDTYGGFKLYRNSAEVSGASSNAATGSNANLFINYAHRDADAPYESDTFGQQYLDSPGSTSALTYTIYWARLYGGTMKINGPYFVDSGNTYTNFAPSSITLMEIAA